MQGVVAIYDPSWSFYTVEEARTKLHSIPYYQVWLLCKHPDMAEVNKEHSVKADYVEDSLPAAGNGQHSHGLIDAALLYRGTKNMMCLLLPC